MKKLDCSEVEKDLWRYVDRELAASGVAAVSEHLKGCDACQTLYHERAREANVCRRALSAAAMGPETSERIVRAMARAGLFHQEAGVEERGPGEVVRGLKTRVREHLALVAVFLIATTVGLSFWLFDTGPPTVLGEFAADGVVWRSQRSGKALAGSAFVVPEDVELRLRLRTRTRRIGAQLTITGPAKLILDDRSTLRSFSAVLERGLLKARVAPRHPSDGPFVIRTPEARVRVVGTEFVVDATGDGVTRLEVSHGVVDFRAVGAPAGEPGVRVTAETGARVVRRGDLTPAPVAAVTASSDSSEERGDTGVTNAGVSDEGSASDREVDSPNRVDRPEGGSSGLPAASDGPSLHRPSVPVDLDQVVNPRTGKEEKR